MPDISKTITSFFKGLAEIIRELRKNKNAGIKAIVLITMCFIALIGLVLSAQNGAPFWAILGGSYIYLYMFYQIMMGCVKIDRRKRRRPKVTIKA